MLIVRQDDGSIKLIDELLPEITEQPGLEPDFEPTEQDWADYDDYLERQRYEYECQAWTIRPI